MRKDGFFPITSIHRADLEDRGFDTSKVTDRQMKRLAEKMGELYVESGGFWDHMEEIAEAMKIPRRSVMEESCVEDEWPKRKVI